MAKIEKTKIKKTPKRAKKKIDSKSRAKIEAPVPHIEPEVDNSTGERTLRYYGAVGRRKRAVARVWLFTRGEKDFSVNSKPYIQYFSTEELRQVADGALRKMKVMDKFNVRALVRGGGIAGQAEAVRHGTARALLRFNPDFRKRLKRAGFLRRDPRKKERRKFGLKKARRAPQWSKR